MRALRDFNLPKIVSDDNPVFLGLISDLYPSLDVPRKRELESEKAVKHAACDLKLQPEESFVLKVVQLEELLYVRHSVFIGKHIKYKFLICSKAEKDKNAIDISLLSNYWRILNTLGMFLKYVTQKGFALV